MGFWELVDKFSIGIHYFFSFIFIITILVFVHELGHYLAAKFAGVKVDKFAIGMGKTILSWQDKSGTKWCINCLPIGGYVQMFGDAGAASNPDQELLQNMSKEAKKKSFYFQGSQFAML
jgi:regulator of sigma E protease